MSSAVVVDADEPRLRPGSSLLEPEFLRRLERLKLLARRRFRGAASGSRRARAKGSSAEFADHRPYAPGDDTRRIDWNAYARLGELVMRLYVAEQDLAVTLLIDRSASLGVGSPPKIDVARRVAAALGYLALAQGERVGVVPFAAGVGRPLEPGRGRARVGKLLRYLDSVEVDGTTDLGRAVDAFLARRPRPGLVCVLSDLLDPGGFRRPLDRLISEGHEPAIFHILDAAEFDPTPGGDFALVDVERGTRVEVSLDQHAIAAYRARVTAFLADVEGYARSRGLSHVRVGGDVDFEDALLTYLRS